jgi:hypothetical protein
MSRLKLFAEKYTALQCLANKTEKIITTGEQSMPIQLTEAELNIIKQLPKEITEYLLSHIKKPVFIQLATQIIQDFKFESHDQANNSIYRIIPPNTFPEQIGFLLTCYFNAKLFNRHIDSQENVDAIISDTNLFAEQKNNTYILKFSENSAAEDKFKQLKSLTR